MSITTEAPGKLSIADYQVPARSPLARAWRIPGAAGALGFGIAAYGFKYDADRFAFSYLFGFFVALSLALGSLFFILVLYVTKAAWGVTVRRVAELFIRPMAVFAVLAIPLVFSMNSLFPWLGTKQEVSQTAEPPLAKARGDADREPAGLRDLPVANASRMANAEEAAEGSIVEHKSFYLNRRFVLFRLLGYLGIWSWLAHRYFQWSSEQDATRNVENTAAAQRFAPPALILFGFTLTFFAFDWLLSLDATWYSTIFGVYVFAQCTLFQMATLIAATLLLRRAGFLRNAVNVEHFHDMGKLLFGWIVFWSYIAFAQFFLTWYSNIPDEVAWFHKRWDENGGDWMLLSVALVLLHFFIPFWFLMSRNIKRRLPLLAIGAACMMVMHVLEVYWVIMPNLGPLSVSLLDVGCLIGVLGVYLATVLYGIEEHPLVPIGDPRLVRALKFENV